MVLGQQIARKLKTIYGVERVAFLYTGGDIPHVHSHLVPMHAKTDITSARYIVSPETVEFASEHLLATREELLRAQREPAAR
jgi:histidine triad (HIT) family protein